MSYAKISAATIKAQISKNLTMIENTRKREDEILIEKIIANGRHKKLFSKADTSPVTWDEVIEYLDAASKKACGDTWHWLPNWRSTVYYKQRERMNALQTLAEHGDPVAVSAEDADILFSIDYDQVHCFKMEYYGLFKVGVNQAKLSGFEKFVFWFCFLGIVFLLFLMVW